MLGHVSSVCISEAFGIINKVNCVDVNSAFRVLDDLVIYSWLIKFYLKIPSLIDDLVIWLFVIIFVLEKIVKIDVRLFRVIF